MIEKLENKINKEINKVLEKNDYTLNEIKTLIDIRTSMEMKEFLKNSITLSNTTSFNCIKEGDETNDSNNN